MAGSVFDTRANPDITTTDTTTNAAPDYYTKYLGGLSQAGQEAIANPNKVAGLTSEQLAGWGMVPSAAVSYKPGLANAEATANKAAAGAAPQIEDFMNPYTTNVVDEMARLQQQNVQRNLLPQLKAGFVGTGGLGSTRYANALSQTMSDLQSNLTGQQYGALSAAQKAAIDAALSNTQNQNQAARTQGDLATTEQTSGLAGANALTKAGTEQQTFNQSLIDAPLKTATNAAALLRGYTVPGSTTKSTTGPMTSGYYQGSPLAQVLGTGSLLASSFGYDPKNPNGGGLLGYLEKSLGPSLSAGASSIGSSIKDWWNNTNATGSTSPYQGQNDPQAMYDLTHWNYDPAGDPNYGSNYDPNSGRTADLAQNGISGHYDENWNWIPD